MEEEDIRLEGLQGEPVHSNYVYYFPCTHAAGIRICLVGMNSDITLTICVYSGMQE